MKFADDTMSPCQKLDKPTKSDLEFSFIDCVDVYKCVNRLKLQIFTIWYVQPMKQLYLDKAVV